MVSATTQLKLIAADGKKYKTDVMDYNQVIELAKNFPNNKFHKNNMRVFDRKLGKQPQVAAFTYTVPQRKRQNNKNLAGFDFKAQSEKMC